MGEGNKHLDNGLWPGSKVGCATIPGTEDRSAPMYCSNAPYGHSTSVGLQRPGLNNNSEDVFSCKHLASLGLAADRRLKNALRITHGDSIVKPIICKLCIFELDFFIFHALCMEDYHPGPFCDTKKILGTNYLVTILEFLQKWFHQRILFVMLLRMVSLFWPGNKPRKMLCTISLCNFTTSIAPKHIFCKELLLWSFWPRW